MQPVETWSDVLAGSFQDVTLQIAEVVPRLAVATIIFIIGWLVGSVLGGVVSHICRTFKFDKALASLGADELAEHAGMKLDSGRFLGALVKWFFIIVFLLTSVNILGLNEVSTFLRESILGYLPNVVIATLMLLLAAVAAQAIQSVVSASARAAGFAGAELLGTVAKWAILVSAILPVLAQLEIGEGFPQILFQAIVQGISGMIAIAGGIAFGLGGKDSAGELISWAQKQFAIKK